MSGDLAEKKQGSESKRGRIRRLLFEPLERDGFRKSAKVAEDKHKAVMARLADDLTYMSDERLGVLRQMLKSHGQGRHYDIWPSVATITALAERIEPRPVEELPGLVRWFRSVEGPRARAAGTLVETWSYFHRNKRPPIGPGAARELAERAETNRRHCELTRERMRRGTADEADIARLRAYEAKLAYCEDLVAGGQNGDAA